MWSFGDLRFVFFLFCVKGLFYDLIRIVRSICFVVVVIIFGIRLFRCFFAVVWGPNIAIVVVIVVVRSCFLVYF